MPIKNPNSIESPKAVEGCYLNSPIEDTAYGRNLWTEATGERNPERVTAESITKVEVFEKEMEIRVSLYEGQSLLAIEENGFEFKDNALQLDDDYDTVVLVILNDFAHEKSAIFIREDGNLAVNTWHFTSVTTILIFPFSDGGCQFSMAFERVECPLVNEP